MPGPLPVSRLSLVDAMRGMDASSHVGTPRELGTDGSVGTPG